MGYRRVLYIGGTGPSGIPVARAFLAAGYGVRTLARDPEAARAAFPPPFEVFPGDSVDPDALADAATGCDGIYAAPGTWSAADADGEIARMVLIARTASTAGIGRLTYLSAGVVALESASYPPVRAKLAGERIVAASGVPYTILRPSWFMEMLPGFFAGKRATVIGRIAYRWHWLAADDFARIAVRLHGDPRAAGREFAIRGPEAHTLANALAIYGQHALGGIAVTEVPFWKARLISFIAPRQQVRAVFPFMRFLAAATEHGNSRDADEIAGAAETSIDAWARARRQG